MDGTRLDVGKAGPPAPALQTLLACAALSTDATRAGPVGTSLDTQWVGDPTEVALVRAADEADVKKESLETLLPRVSELPFDSSRKRMTTVHRVLDALPLAPLIQPGQEVPHVVITKGALDVVLPRSTSVWSHGSDRKSTRLNSSHT